MHSSTNNLKRHHKKVHWSCIFKTPPLQCHLFVKVHRRVASSKQQGKRTWTAKSQTWKGQETEGHDDLTCHKHQRNGCWPPWTDNPKGTISMRMIEMLQNKTPKMQDLLIIRLTVLHRSWSPHMHWRPPEVGNASVRLAIVTAKLSSCEQIKLETLLGNT